MLDKISLYEKLVNENREKLEDSITLRVMPSDIEKLVDEGAVEPEYLEMMPAEGYFGFYRVYTVHGEITAGELKSGLDYHWSAPLNVMDRSDDTYLLEMIGDRALANASVLINIKPLFKANKVTILCLSDNPQKAIDYFLAMADRIKQIDSGSEHHKDTYRMNLDMPVVMTLMDLKKSQEIGRIEKYTGLHSLSGDSSRG